jgi:hypothetical protein
VGDFFGNYTNYAPGDFGMDDREDQDMDGPIREDPNCPAETEEEEEIALYEAIRAEEEERLEHERPSRRPDITDQEMEQDVPPSHVPFCLRGGFEGPLSNQPEVMEFSAGSAGARNPHSGNQRYH